MATKGFPRKDLYLLIKNVSSAEKIEVLYNHILGKTYTLNEKGQFCPRKCSVFVHILFF